MSEQIYGPLITGGCALLFGWLLIIGLRDGRIEWPYYGITLSGRRDDQPVRFWTVAALLGFFAFGCVLATVGQVFFPHGMM